MDTHVIAEQQAAPAAPNVGAEWAAYMGHLTSPIFAAALVVSFMLPASRAVRRSRRRINITSKRKQHSMGATGSWENA